MSELKRETTIKFSSKKIEIDDDPLVSKSILDMIEVIDDDDLSAVDAALRESNRVLWEIEKGIDLDDVIPDETPFYIQSPGFDDCLSPEEASYIRKKHPNIVLVDSITKCGDDNQQFEPADLTFKEFLFSQSDDFETLDTANGLAEDEALKKMIKDLEGVF